MNYYEYFDSPSTGTHFEYEMLIANKDGENNVDFEFGFCSGVSPVLSFYIKSGKLYDEDGNFVYHFGKNEREGMELYGNVFHDYHNYSIDRVPVNLDCSKVEQPDGKNYVDGFYSSTTGVNFALKAYGEQSEADY